jgi:hypothetical protein
MTPTRVRVWFLGVWFLVVPLSTAAVAAPVLPPGSTVEGRTLGEWSAAYWQWTLSLTTLDEPLNTVHDPVNFLAAGAGVPVVFDVEIPEGGYLFFPLLTTAQPRGPGQTLDDVRAIIDGIRPGITDLHATLNGIPIPNLFDHWEESPEFFPVTIPDGGIFTPPGTFEALAGGYWLMLQLPRGQHTLTFGGAVPDFEFVADATATITVVPEPGSLGLMLVAGLALGAWRSTRRTYHRH